MFNASKKYTGRISGIGRTTWQKRRPMMVEQLEDRRVLAVVTSLADSGAGSLRAALAGPDPSITFSVSGTINLTSGELAVNRAVSIDATGQTVTVNNTVSGNRVFNIDDGDGTANLDVTINNLTISGGSVSPNGAGNTGGGIRNGERLTLTNSVVSGNSAGVGGGVANVNGAQLTATNIDVRQNAAYYSGGGVSVSASSTASIAGSQVRNNSVGTANGSTYSSFGGGLFNAGSLTVTGTTISDNQSKHTDLAGQSAFGGGVASTGSATTNISSSTISNNRADEMGGGLSGSGGATTHTLNNVNITGNYAGLNATGNARGGGMYIAGAQDGTTRVVPNVTITGGTISDNQAQNGPVGVATTGLGGGVFLSINVEGQIDGTSVKDNIAFSKGGGMWLSNFSAQGDAGAHSNLVVRNAMITGNSIPNALNSATPPAALFPYGGGVYQAVNVNFELIDSEVRDNVIGVSNTVQGNSRGAGLFARAINGTATNRFSVMTVRNSTIAGNVAHDIAASGGGIHLSQGAQAHVIGSTIENNTSDGGNGGGIAMLFDAPSLTVEDSIIRNNTAQDDPASTFRAYGGGIASNVGVVNVLRSQILNNTGDWGGGLALRSLDGLIQDSVISGNSATGYGGGLQFFRRANVVGDFVIENSTISNNTGGTVDAGRTGGGISSTIYSGSDTGATNLTIRGTTISNNLSHLDGGGMEVVGSFVVIENSTLANNQAGGPSSTSGEGGAIWFTNTDGGTTGSLQVNFSTISGNSSLSSGGGIWNDSSNFDMSNSIASDNTAGTGTYYNDVVDLSYLDSIKFSLVEDYSGNLASNNPTNIVGVSANLGLLANNGGPTQTMMPNAGSPVLDAADPASTVDRDQRDFTRPGTNTSRDMGAVEHDGEAATITGDFDNNGIYDCNDINMLTTAVANGGPVAPFDLNGDGLLSMLDVNAWLAEAGGVNIGPNRPYKGGDANLDGVVDGSDFGIWNSNKFTQNTNWCNGNFNGDQFVDGSDFGVWNSNKFTASDAGRSSPTRSVSASKSSGDQKVEELTEQVSEFDLGVVLSTGGAWRDGDGGIASRPGMQLQQLIAPPAAVRVARHFALPTQTAVTVTEFVPQQAAKARTVASQRVGSERADDAVRDSIFEQIGTLASV